MINLDINKNKNIKNIKEKKKSIQTRPEVFRPSFSNQRYLMNVYNKSKFIDRAVAIHINLINDPKILLEELKRRHPNLYKSVGRKKF